MSNWIMYDSDGEIQHYGSCAEADIVLQIPITGETLLQGYGTPATHYVLNGVITLYTSTQMQAKAVFTPYGKWSNISFSYVDQRTPAEIAQATITNYIAAAQLLLDTYAQSWGYDSLLSATSYAASGVAKFKAEALALIGWRDSVWNTAYTIEAAVIAGTQTMPATAADFLALLPAQPARPM